MSINNYTYRNDKEVMWELSATLGNLTGCVYRYAHNAQGHTVTSHDIYNPENISGLPLYSFGYSKSIGELIEKMEFAIEILHHANEE